MPSWRRRSLLPCAASRTYGVRFASIVASKLLTCKVASKLRGLQELDLPDGTLGESGALDLLKKMPSGGRE